MPLTLIPPGTRRNRYWVARGSVAGTLVERSLGTTSRREAQQRLRALERALLGAPRPGARITFSQAAELYQAYRPTSAVDSRQLARIGALLGSRALDQIRHADLVDIANRLYPTGHPATKNRRVLGLAARVLHYGAANGYCPYLKIPLFREPAPRVRAVSLELAQQLIAAAPAGPKRRLLVWLFGQGTRISDTLRVHWNDIDLSRNIVRLHIQKTDRWREFPLHPAVLAELQAVPPADRAGRVFPWSDRNSVYHWLRPLAASVGVPFTPHVARHTLGAALNAAGAGLRTIMEALGHDSVQSSIRYQSAHLDIVRAALTSAVQLEPGPGPGPEPVPKQRHGESTS